MNIKNIIKYLTVLSFMLVTLGMLRAESIETHPFYLAIESSFTDTVQETTVLYPIETIESAFNF